MPSVCKKTKTPASMRKCFDTRPRMDGPILVVSRATTGKNDFRIDWGWNLTGRSSEVSRPMLSQRFSRDSLAGEEGTKLRGPVDPESDTARKSIAERQANEIAVRLFANCCIIKHQKKHMMIQPAFVAFKNTYSCVACRQADDIAVSNFFIPIDGVMYNSPNCKKRDNYT